MLEALNGAMANLKNVIVEKNMDVRDAQRDNVAVIKDLLEIVTDTLGELKNPNAFKYKQIVFFTLCLS